MVMMAVEMAKKAAVIMPKVVEKTEGMTAEAVPLNYNNEFRFS